MNWASIISNFLSGGFGVVITLALTGFWNWKDQRKTRKALELQEIFNYLRVTNELVRGLAVEVDFHTKDEEDKKDILGGHALLSAFHLAEENYVRLATLISDEQIICIAKSNLRELEEFRRLVFTLDPEAMPEGEIVAILNRGKGEVTRAITLGNRKISKRVVHMNGPK